MLATNKVVVIGGSSGMGLAIARRALAAGARVALVARGQRRLSEAVEALNAPGLVQAYVADIGNLQQVKELFVSVGELDHLVITAADLVYGPLRTLQESDVMRAVRSKLLGPIFAAQESASRIRPGGSITLTTGIAARRPLVGGSMAAALNASLEGLG